jgi:hypothetical protein
MSASIVVAKWSAVLATTLAAVTAHAQEVPVEQNASPGSMFEETMSTGLIPLFTAIGAGIAIMFLLAAIVTIALRPRLPRFPTEA